MSLFVNKIVMKFEGEQPAQEDENEIQGRETETEVESQEVDEELVERIVDELTKEIESDVELLRKKVKEREDFGKDEETGEVRPSHLTDIEFKKELLFDAEEELRKKKEEIRKEAESILSMNEERIGQLKEFLEERKQEAEIQSEEFNRLFERRLQMIKMSEEAKEKVE